MNDKEKKKKLAYRWFYKAQEDENAIRVLLKEGGPYSIICFLAQQIAEKYLKSFIVLYDLKLKKIHDLLGLAEIIEDKIPKIKEFKKDLAYLNRFYIETRYPGDSHEDFSEKDAKEAFVCALKIKDIAYEVVKNF